MVTDEPSWMGAGDRHGRSVFPGCSLSVPRRHSASVSSALLRTAHRPGILCASDAAVRLGP
jgi:hypothetical protein